MDPHAEEKPVNLAPWQKKLQELSDKLFGPEEDAWVITEYKKIQDATHPHPRLLKQEEKVGIIEMPIIIGKGYISDLAWSLLTREGYKLEWVMSQYTIVHNCKLIGIADEMLQETTNVFSYALKGLQEFDTSLNGLGVGGPIRGVGPHLYIPLFPAHLVADNEIVISDWDFLGAGKPARRIEMTSPATNNPGQRVRRESSRKSEESEE